MKLPNQLWEKSRAGPISFFIPLNFSGQVDVISSSKKASLLDIKIPTTISRMKAAILLLLSGLAIALPLPVPPQDYDADVRPWHTIFPREHSCCIIHSKESFLFSSVVLLEYCRLSFYFLFRSMWYQNCGKKVNFWIHFWNMNISIWIDFGRMKFFLSSLLRVYVCAD